MFETTSAKIITQSTDMGLSQVFEYCPDDPGLKGTKGCLYLAITQESSDHQAVNALAFVRDLAKTIQDSYFRYKGGIADGLSRAVEKASQLSERNGRRVSLAAVVLCGDRLVAISIGGSEVILYRDGNLARILSAQSNQKIASGMIKEKDKLLISTGNIIGRISTGVIRAALGASSIKSFPEKLPPSILSGEYPTAVLALGFENATNPPVQINVAREKSKQVALVSDEADRLVVVAPEKTSEKRTSVRKFAVKLIDALLMAVTVMQRPFKGKGTSIVQDPMQTLEHERKRKVAITVGALLLLILVVSIVFGVKQSKERRYQLELQAQISEIEHQLKEAYSLSELSPARSRELILEAQSNAQNLREQGYQGEELDNLISKIESGIGDLAGIYEGGTEQYLDLTLISNDFNGDTVNMSDGRMLVLDRDNDTLVEIVVESKRTEVLAGPDDISEAEEVALYADESYVTVNGNVFVVEGDSANLGIGDEWEGDVLIGAFAGNLYVLDKGDSSIVRYPKLRDSFGGGSEWLTEGVEADLSNASKLMIDGSIWVLDGDRIYQFSRGNRIPFSLNGVEGELGSINDFFVDEDTVYLYILDASNSRVLVFEKNGNFKSEYKSEHLRDAKQVVVSETQKKLIFLTGDKLFEVELRHF